MIFVFVDDTGDPGKRKILSHGSTPYFGMVAISIMDKDYIALRHLLSQVHWLRGTATSINTRGEKLIWAFNFLRGLKELEANAVISASALYIIKADYGGRYLTWSDYGIPKRDWPYHLRNYLLRHLLEHHFHSNIPSDSIDLILDRILLNEEQRINTHKYLNSQISPLLREPFAIPHIQHLTLADSEYVGGLEIAHLLADVLKRRIENNIPQLMDELSRFVRIVHFKGGQQMP